MKFQLIAGLIVVIGFALNSSFFVVTEGRQAIITQFGKPVGEPITKAGLHVKVPFIHDARFVDKRILSWDGYPNQIPTKDKKYIMVDTAARWRVVDALTFIQTVENEEGARRRLDTILDSHTRDVISSQNLVESVRNSNGILDKIETRKKEIEQALKENNELVIEEEITGDIEKIEVGREKLSDQIVKLAQKDLQNLGIELIDVQLRRISYERSVEEKVFERMISERQRIAQKIRSVGQGERAKIEGRLYRDLEKIKSEAYRTSQTVKGRAEAQATSIYAKSLNLDPKFYEFSRSLEAYKTSLKDRGQFILSSDSDYLKFLKKLE